MGPRRTQMGSEERSTSSNFIVCTAHIIKLERLSRILRWAGHVARMGEDRSAFNILAGKRIGK